jgi:hypothetical protein
MAVRGMILTLKTAGVVASEQISLPLLRSRGSFYSAAPDGPRRSARAPCPRGGAASGGRNLGVRSQRSEAYQLSRHRKDTRSHAGSARPTPIAGYASKCGRDAIRALELADPERASFAAAATHVRTITELDALKRSRPSRPQPADITLCGCYWRVTTLLSWSAGRVLRSRAAGGMTETVSQAYAVVG